MTGIDVLNGLAPNRWEAVTWIETTQFSGSDVLWDMTGALWDQCNG